MLRDEKQQTTRHRAVQTIPQQMAVAESLYRERPSFHLVGAQWEVMEREEVVKIL
jgi:hypothetical protein